MNLSKFKSIDQFIGALYIFCFVSGYIGFSQYYEIIDEDRQFLTKVYYTLQLFVLNYSPSVDKVPVLLNIARFLAPLLLAGTILNLIFSTIKTRINLLIIRHTHREHIVFCGLGYKSYLLILDYLKHTDHKIVVIEKNQENLLIGKIRNKKVRFILGNSEDPILLKQANILKAKTVFVLTGDDKTNINITHKIAELYEQERMETSLKIILHISDYFNMNIFKEFQEKNSGNIDFHAFNIFQKIASVVVGKYSPDLFKDFDNTSDPNCNILIHGFNKIGEHIILEAIHLYHFANLKKLIITVIDDKASEKANSFMSRFPLLNQIVRMEFLNTEDFINNRNNKLLAGISLCFICGDLESECYTIANRYRQIFYKSSLEKLKGNVIENVQNKYLMEYPKIVALLPVDPGILDLFRNFSSICDSLFIDRFAAYKHVCNKQLIADDKDLIDNIAIQIHNLYMGLGESELLLNWENLTEREKDFNRFPARHLAIKLRYLKLAMVPVSNQNSEFKITAIPKEKHTVLAKMEHNRWVAEKILEGYIQLDEVAFKGLNLNLRKYLHLHKDIKPWEELTKSDQDKDSLFMDNIQKIVSATGNKLISNK